MTNLSDFTAKKVAEFRKNHRLRSMPVNEAEEWLSQALSDLATELREATALHAVNHEHYVEIDYTCTDCVRNRALEEVEAKWKAYVDGDQL